MKQKHIDHMFWLFDDLDGLDPVHVHLEAYPAFHGAPAEGAAFHISIHCYGQAWVTFFGSPTGTPTSFLRSCDTDYIANRLCNVQWKTKAGERQELAYVKRIWDAIRGRILTQEEANQQRIAEMVESLPVVDYTDESQAPGVLDSVVAQYVGDTKFYGPANAGLFAWPRKEGEPCIDKFWIIPAEVKPDGN